MDALERDLIEARDLSRMLILIAERTKRQFTEAVAPFDLAPNEARALMWLSTPISMRDLAEALACDPSYVTGLADQLEERGLIVRVPGKDRRIKLLQLTQEGSVVRRQAVAAVQERVGLAEQLSSADRATLKRLLGQLLTEGEGP